MTPEGKVKAMVKKGLDQFGRHSYKFMPVQTGYGSRTLDFLICFRGWFVSIETKAAGEKPTPLQYTTIDNMDEANGIVFVVDDQASCDITMNVLKELPWLIRPTSVQRLLPSVSKKAA